MSMLAKLHILSLKGPQALQCVYCRKAFVDGMLITGSRNREGSSSHAYTYWHDNCERPYGFAPTQTLEVKLGDSTGWQRTPTDASQATNTSTVRSASDSNTQSTTTTDEADLVTRIVAAINQTLMPQLESAVAQLDTEITAAKTEASTSLDSAVASIVTMIIDAKADAQSQIDSLKARQPVVLHIKMHDNTTRQFEVGRQHVMFPLMLEYISAGATNLWVTGPAGSGKSTAAEMVAKALGYEFHIQPMVSDPVDLLGYMSPATNAAGSAYVPTNFYRAYTATQPTILLMDEIDGWDARSGIVANGALANGHCAFPHGTFERQNCIIIATANTWGLGANADFVGRNKLDATTLDRFITIEWDYDESFERDLCGYHTGNANVDSWVDAVIEARHKAIQVAAKIQITPRASIDGAMLIRANMSRANVLTARFARNRSHPMWPSVGQVLEDWAKRPHSIVRNAAAEQAATATAAS